MKRNLANWDRLLRLGGGVGTVIGAFTFMEPGLLTYMIMASGAVLVMTGAAARCPMCVVAGVSTLEDNG